MSILILDLATTSTLLHEAIAAKSDAGLEIGVIYFNKKKFIKSKIKNKFFINLTNNREISDDAVEIIRSIEKKENQRFSKFLYLDRYIGNKDVLARYYSNFILDFNRIIENEKPTMVIGELSLGWEILGYYLCKGKNINYVLPLNVYVLENPRLSFFDINHDISIINKISEISTDVVEDDCIKKLIDSRKKTDINKGFGSKLRSPIDLNMIKRFKYNLFMRDESDYRERISRKIKNRLSLLWNKMRNKNFISCYGRDNIDVSYYLIMLHIQPEVTPDTTATYYSNQYELIRQAALRLPFGSILYVKEHPNGLGCRNISFLREVSKLPNVYFLKNEITSTQAIKKSEGVISVCGTGSFEAALYGRKGAVFNNVFFSEYPGVFKLKDYSDLDIFYNSSVPVLSENEDVEFYKKIIKGTFNCFWHQPIMMEGVLDHDNISAIRKAIEITNNVLANKKESI